MALSPVKIAQISADIIDLSTRIGVLQGRAETVNFFPLPAAARYDAGKIDLINFADFHQPLLTMRLNLDGMYRHFQILTEECALISNEEIRGIFEEQIKALHGKRAVLDTGLRSFDNLLKSHSQLLAISSQIDDEAELVASYEAGELDIESAPELRERLKELLGQVNFILPLFRHDGPEFCKKHFKWKNNLCARIYELQMRINLKEIKMRKELNPYELIAKRVEERPARTFEEMKEWVQAIQSEERFTSEERETLAEEVLRGAEKNGLALNKPYGVYHWVWFLAQEKDSNADWDNFGKIQAPKDTERLIEAISQSQVERPLVDGNLASALKAANDSVKSLAELKRLLEQLRVNKQLKAQEMEQICSALLSSAEKGGLKLDQNQSVYYWVWFLAHEKDSSAGGDNFGKIQAPKDIERLIKAISQSEAKRPLAEGNLASTLKAADDPVKPLAELKPSLPEGNLASALKAADDPVKPLAELKPSLPEGNLASALKVADDPIKSLAELKRSLKELRVNKQLKAQEIEKICSALLSSAEKGGLKLDQNQSVYYWVWFLAHEKDSSAGGDNFGKIQAPKDIERLIKAISQSEVNRPLVDGNLASALKAANDPIKSLAELKRSLEQLRDNKQLKAQEIEQLCSALLSSAEKNGLKLDQNQSVYYWVWFLAHQKDSSVGGDNFGKIQAPKDLNRLIEAVARSKKLWL